MSGFAFDILVKFADIPEGQKVHVDTVENKDDLLDVLDDILRRPWIQNIEKIEVIISER